MDYIVIDFETANSKRDSACALGIIEMSEGKKINEWDYLINPEASFNTFLHGFNYDTKLCLDI